LGYRLLQRLATDVQDLGFIESNPKQDGRNMIMVLAPHKNIKPRVVKQDDDATEADDTASEEA
jgi:translation initiation factor IF-3